MPLRVVITEGARANYTRAYTLIEGFEAEYLFADRGYGSDTGVRQARRQRQFGIGLFGRISCDDTIQSPNNLTCSLDAHRFLLFGDSELSLRDGADTRHEYREG